MKSKSEYDLKAIGRRIKEARKHLSILQDTIAEECNLSKTTISDFERGEKRPGFDLLYYLHTRYNISIDYILFGVGNLVISKESPNENKIDLTSFGSDLEIIKEMLEIMKQSIITKSAIIGHYRTFVIENPDLIEKDIEITKNKK